VSPPTLDLNERQRAYLLAVFETDQELSRAISAEPVCFTFWPCPRRSHDRHRCRCNWYQYLLGCQYTVRPSRRQSDRFRIPTDDLEFTQESVNDV
jgi:hypothetical protein